MRSCPTSVTWPRDSASPAPPSGRRWNSSSWKAGCSAGAASARPSPRRVAVSRSTPTGHLARRAGDAWQPVDAVAADSARRGRRPSWAPAGTTGPPVRRSRITTASRSPPNCCTSRGGGARLTARMRRPPRAPPDAVLRELQALDLAGRESAVELGSARATTPSSWTGCPGAPSWSSPRATSRRTASPRSPWTYRADTCRLTFGETGDVQIHEDA